jgi:nucleoside-diphosphate-sugar epimerase
MNASTPSPLMQPIPSEEALVERLTRPRPVLVEFIKTLRSPLVLLGAGGKMGPTLAGLARRAALAANHLLKVVAVSRFSNPAPRRWLESQDVTTIACDLLDRQSFELLPDTENLVFLVGVKFGTTAHPAATWAANTLVPAYACERYPRARMSALSTGNVYPLVPASGPGPDENHPLAPVGEYGTTAVARERIFEFFSKKNSTPLTLVRLNYAVDLRYGVPVDVAQKVRAGLPVDLSMGCFNCIWQGDANEMVLRCLALAKSPPAVLNLTGPDKVSVRELALEFGRQFGRAPCFAGEESPTALLSSSRRACELLGPPPTSLEMMVQWIAHWLAHDGPTWNKPTGFERRDGQF